jgi:hypothetical protein
MTKTDTELMQIRDDLNNGEGMDTEWTQDRLNDVLDSHFDANTEIARLQKELHDVFEALKKAAIMQGDCCPFGDMEGPYDDACEVKGNIYDGIESCRAREANEPEQEYEKCWIGFYLREA